MNHLASKYFLFLYLILPLVIYFFLKRKKASVNFPTVRYIKQSLGDSKIVRYIPLSLRVIALSLIIFALARPQHGRTYERVTTKGIDIVLVIDVSGSMAAIDLQPKNRLQAAINVADEFIRDRGNDRIGLVAFAKYAYIQCPLTANHAILLGQLHRLHMGMIEDGTAIGLGLSSAVNSLKNSKAKSKVVILLTDGRNNAGEIDPLTAGEIASALGIKVYTIGVGSRSEVLFPYKVPGLGTRYIKMKSDVDEKTLTKIADETGGIYFRADNTEALKNIYKKIDNMEKTKIIVKKRSVYKELYAKYLILALIFLLLEFFVSKLIINRIV
ncbi:MAG: VWA domain-containing protein [Proteobacteria bacterium]|nr:VWA domain-containing protein [Pseudomonadota bacterium]